MEDKAIFPGSFDPFHNGHLEVLNLSLNDFKFVYLFVANNTQKKHYLDLDSRYLLLGKMFKNDERVIVKKVPNDQLIPNISNELEIKNIIRAIRYPNDQEYEVDLKLSYLNLNPNLNFYYYQSVRFPNLSSSFIKEKLLQKNDIEIKKYLPNKIYKDIINKYR